MSLCFGPIDGQSHVPFLFFITCRRSTLLIRSLILINLVTHSGATGGYLGYLWGSVSTTIVGGVAAGAAYGLVKAMGVQE